MTGRYDGKGFAMQNVEMSLTNFTLTNQLATAELFGGNAVIGPNTNAGTPTSEFKSAQSAIGITNIRFPGGDTPTLYQNGLLKPNGELIDEVTNFLDWAQANGKKVSLVTPIRDGIIPQNFQDLTDFVELVLLNYGDVIAQFEIGNEFWGEMGETEYGQRANKSIIAIQNGIIGSGYNPDILVQMANVTASNSEFNASSDGFSQRIESANQTIIDQLSSAARGALDGVIEHYYFKDDGEISFDGSSREMGWIDKSMTRWNAAFGSDFELHVTEWNIDRRANDLNGIRAASTILEQFEYMLDLGVDSAYVWPVQMNTRTDLAGHPGDNLVMDPATGILLNTVRGAIFDMMTNSIIGMERVEADFSNNNGSIEINTFQSDEKVVFYVSSRSLEKQTFDLDFSQMIGAYNRVSGIQLGYDPNSSNGQHWNGETNIASEFVIIDGTPYYWNEHDVQAKITQLNETQLVNETQLGGGTHLTVTLKPYEVIEITYELSQINIINGTSGIDVALVGTNGVDKIIGFAGADTLEGRGGNDELQGGAGSDKLFGEAGNDILNGGAGNDTIAGADGDDLITGELDNDNIGGGQGNDTIDGGAGDDTIGGGFGADRINGDAGNDVVSGGADNDTLSGGEGNDSISGSFGNDLIFGDDGNDDIGGGAGQDTIKAGAGDDSVGGGEGNDSILGGAGNDFLAGGGRDDVISGGTGNDTINGGAGNDRMKGGAGADQFVFSEFFSGEADVITDFEDGIDSFLIRRFNPETGVENINNGGNGLAGFVTAMNIIDTDAGAQMTVNGNTILVEGVTAAQLTVDDFQFL
jgi:Ca2+-binding RTX toxin-like protein